MSRVYLIGAGPGDPGLLTLRGRELLGRADVVVYDALANEALLDLARPDAERVYVGKIAGSHALPQDGINALLAEKAGAGKTVARLKGGDPYIFGRGGEEAEYLHARGIPFEEVPGISSAIAAPAYAGIPLTHRDFCQAVTIVTGHRRAEKDGLDIDWRGLALSRATLVFVMGMRNLPLICRNLVGAGLDPGTPAAVVHRGASPAQRSVFAPLAELAQKALAAGLSNPAVIVVGPVVSLADKLGWYHRLPLFGKKIVVTRSRAQASDMARQLAELGAEVLECPGIAIRPLESFGEADSAIRRLGGYQWLVLTSANGVDCFWRRLAACGLDSRALGGLKIAAIGPGTADALSVRGIRPDFLPERFVAESVAEGLVGLLGDRMAGTRFLLPRAAAARDALPSLLRAAGAEVDIVPLYSAEPVPIAPEMLERLAEVDCISFASSSTVRNFLAQVPARKIRELGIALAAIGPITAQTLREAGLEPDIMPEKYTIADMVSAIAAHYDKA